MTTNVPGPPVSTVPDEMVADQHTNGALPLDPSDRFDAIDQTHAVGRPQESPEARPVLAILSLVFGISGIVLGLVLPLAIAGLVLGILAIRREPKARTMAIWGTATSAVPGILALLSGLFVLAFVVPLGIMAAIVS